MTSRVFRMSKLAAAPFLIPAAAPALVPALLLALSLAPVRARAQGVPADSSSDEGLGTVDFPVGCAPTARREFERGVAMLHSFWFKEARMTFEKAARRDPGCSMAWWGVAMTYEGNPFAGFNVSPDAIRAGRASVQLARATVPPSPREQGYVDAVAELFRDPAHRDGRTRRLAYEAAMKKLSQAHPEDMEARIFYARAVIANATPDDLTFERQKRGAAMLEPLFREHPDHPGLAHYLIHAYDSPELAERGLAAARRYAEIAPAVPHALHMPSHIFTRLGYWDESIATNRRAAEAEKRPTARFHPWDYMVYAYLQEGRDREAHQVVQEAVEAADTAGSPRVWNSYNLAAMPVRYAVERSAWAEAAALKLHPASSPWVEALTRFARGVGAARSGSVMAAQMEDNELLRLGAAAKSGDETYWATAIRAQRLALEAWIAHAGGADDRALTLAAQAAELEETQEKSPVTPGPILPARELQGDLLMELGKPAEAEKAYEAVLKREPNRARALYGLARSAAATGDDAVARKRYGQLAELMAPSDPPRPELTEARAYLEGH